MYFSSAGDSAFGQGPKIPSPLLMEGRGGNRPYFAAPSLPSLHTLRLLSFFPGHIPALVAESGGAFPPFPPSQNTRAGLAALAGAAWIQFSVPFPKEKE